MTPEEKKLILDEFKTITLGELVIESEKQALTLRKYIQNLVRSGTSGDVIKETLLRDLREGGQIFGSFRAQFKATVYKNVESATNKGMQVAQVEKGVILYDWLPEFSERTCQDCINRSQMSARSMKDWEIIGIPGSGVTICGDKCRCRLVASSVYNGNMVKEASKIYNKEKIK